jgi:serine/threonine protein kinase
MRRQTRKQRGGRFIGSGTYGCGFRPALRCAGEAARRPGKFAKLTAAVTAAEEIALRDLLQPLDPRKEFFLYSDTVCDPAPFEASDEADRCKIRFREPPRVVLMSKGGDELGTLRLRPREYWPFFRSLLNIFNGLMLLHSRGLSHMDVKPANIVCRRHRDRTLHTRLIDFGLLVNPRTLDAQAARPSGTFHAHNVHLSDYLYWPFDVRLTYPGMIAKAMAGSYEIDGHLDSFYAELSKDRVSVPVGAILHTRLDVDQVSEIAAAYDTAPSRMALYNRLFSSADIYSLGITLAQIYYRFTGHRDVGGAAPDIFMRNEPGGAFVPVINLRENAHLNRDAITWHQMLLGAGSFRLYSLVRRMIQPDPRRRPRLEAARIAYEEILTEIAPYLTPAQVERNIKPWMLDPNVLVEVSAAGGAGAAASSSSEREGAQAVAEVPAEPEIRAVPAGGAAVVPKPASSNSTLTEFSSTP